MHVGVRFCGGCNPRYNRREFLERSQAENPEDKFEIAEEGVNYECLLVIGGCPSCCASYEEFQYDSLIKVWDEAETFRERKIAL